MSEHRNTCFALARWCLDECKESPVTTHRVWLWMRHNRPDDVDSWDISLYDARRTLQALSWLGEAREISPDWWQVAG